jgi:hypothetical protein
MIFDFFFQLPIYLTSAIIICLIGLFYWLGRTLKKRQLTRHPGEVRENIGPVEGAILGILSLLMGFTFSLDMAKFEQQRRLIAEEAADIHAAILGCDLYPDSVYTSLRTDFKEYIEARISYYDAGIHEEKIEQELERAKMISHRIWHTVALESHDQETLIRSIQMLPAVTKMIDIAIVRDAERISRVPSLVILVLLILVLTAAFILGTDLDSKKKRNRMIVISYAIVMTMVLTLITELNHPRGGLINLDTVQKKIIELRELVE